MAEVLSKFPSPSARKLLFVGSGLSIAMGMKPWDWLLRKIGDTYLDGPELDHLNHILNEPDREYDAADYLDGILGKCLLQEELVSLLSEQQEKVPNNALEDWANILIAMGLDGIVTTNWDILLSYMLPGFRPLIWPDDMGELSRALMDKDRFILYLHGNIERRPLIVTSDDCKQRADTFEKDGLLLGGMMASHYLIVIGYGFSDPHIGTIMELAPRIANEYCSRFILMRKAETREFGHSYPSLERQSRLIPFRDYQKFRDAVLSLVDMCNPDLVTEGILEVRKDIDLYAIIKRQPYTSDMTSILRRRFLESSITSQLLVFSAKFLLDNEIRKDTNACGLSATMLSVPKLRDLWQPDDTVLKALHEFAQEAIGRTDVRNVGVVEPLVFALAVKGVPDAHRQHIEAIIHNSLWGNADQQRVLDYYGTFTNEIEAIDQHIQRDPGRTGLLKANDVRRLLNILTILTPGTATEDRVVSLISRSIEAIREGGEQALANDVGKKMELFLYHRGTRDYKRRYA